MDLIMCANKNLVASLHFAMKIGNRQTRLLGTAIHKMIGWLSNNPTPTGNQQEISDLPSRRVKPRK